MRYRTLRIQLQQILAPEVTTSSHLDPRREIALLPRPSERIFGKNEKPADIAGFRQSFAFSKRSGAGEGARTLDPDLGKVVLYH